MNIQYLLKSLKQNTDNCATYNFCFSVHLTVCPAGFRRPLDIGCHAMTAAGTELYTWGCESQSTLSQIKMCSLDFRASLYQQSSNTRRVAIRFSNQ